MQISNQLQTFKKWIILLMVSLFCSTLSYILYIINPTKLVLDSKLHMAPDSLPFSIWRKPPIDVFIYVYVFNITNPVEFLNGGEKLKVQEIGPYVYQEFLENTNITWGEDTVTYIPRRSVYFNHEKSIGDPEKDLVNVVNIAFLGLSTVIRDAGFLVNFPFTRLANYLGTKPILNITVHDFLWGYEDPLVRLASGIVPNVIDFHKLGLLDRMYDEGENVVVMHTGQKETMTEEVGRYLSIESYNGSPGLSQWGYINEEGNETHPENTKCNRIQGATEGELFPPNVDKNADFRVYRKAFCRAIPIIFQSEITTDEGLRGYFYTADQTFFDPNHPSNACTCRNKDDCGKKGLADLTPCYYNIPIAVSLPHFIDADPSLSENIEGLHPDPDKHYSKIVINPELGIPLHVNSRIQSNLVLKHNSYNPTIGAFKDLTVPLFWSDLIIPELPSNLALLVKFAVLIAPIMQTTIICLLAIAGVVTLVLSLGGSLWLLNQQSNEAEITRRDSTDLRIPLGYGQYSAIRILPAIKKITSKTDLFG